MASLAGRKSEQRLFEYLKLTRHCHRVIEGDSEVRRFLGMPEGAKCADALGILHPLEWPGARRFILGESKGDYVGAALEQLGNAAAGLFETYGVAAQIELLLAVGNLTPRPEGGLSPQGGYRAIPLKTGLGKYSLHESAGMGLPRCAPVVGYQKWKEWSGKVAGLKIVLLVWADLDR